MPIQPPAEPPLSVGQRIRFDYGPMISPPRYILTSFTGDTATFHMEPKAAPGALLMVLIAAGTLAAALSLFW